MTLVIAPMRNGKVLTQTIVIRVTIEVSDLPLSILRYLVVKGTWDVRLSHYGVYIEELLLSFF